MEFPDKKIRENDMSHPRECRRSEIFISGRICFVVEQFFQILFIHGLLILLFHYIQINIFHGDADYAGAAACGGGFEHDGVMFPVVLDMLGLCAFRDGNGDAVVASGKDGHDKGEGSGEVFPFVHNQRFFHVCEKSVVAKKLLPQPVFDKKADDGAVNLLVGLTEDPEDNFFTSYNPVERGALRVCEDDIFNCSAFFTKAGTVFIEPEHLDIIAQV